MSTATVTSTSLTADRSQSDCLILCRDNTALIAYSVRMPDVTKILHAIESGDARAAEKLLPLVYEELRRLAAAKLAHEKPGQTLQATALVHEAYLRLVGGPDEQPWNSRGHFFAAAAEAMRRPRTRAIRPSPCRAGPQPRRPIKIYCRKGSWWGNRCLRCCIPDLCYHRNAGRWQGCRRSHCCRHRCPGRSALRASQCGSAFSAVASRPTKSLRITQDCRLHAWQIPKGQRSRFITEPTHDTRLKAARATAATAARGTKRALMAGVSVAASGIAAIAVPGVARGDSLLEPHDAEALFLGWQRDVLGARAVSRRVHRVSPTKELENR